MARHIQASGIIPPNFIPTELDQHYTDTVAEVSYISKGTSAISDWVAVGGGGGGGGFGIVASRNLKIGNLDADVVDWDITTEGPLIVRFDDKILTVNLNILAATLPTLGQTVQNRLTLMVGNDFGGGAFNVIMNVGSALAAANYSFLYIDEHDASFAYKVAKTLTLENQVLAFDVTMHSVPADESTAEVGIVQVTKIGQHTIIVSDT